MAKLKTSKAELHQRMIRDLAVLSEQLLAFKNKSKDGELLSENQKQRLKNMSFLVDALYLRASLFLKEDPHVLVTAYAKEHAETYPHLAATVNEQFFVRF